MLCALRGPVQVCHRRVSATRGSRVTMSSGSTVQPAQAIDFLTLLHNLKVRRCGMHAGRHFAGSQLRVDCLFCALYVESNSRYVYSYNRCIERQL